MLGIKNLLHLQFSIDDDSGITKFYLEAMTTKGVYYSEEWVDSRNVTEELTLLIYKKLFESIKTNV